jgi:hypothetical protein
MSREEELKLADELEDCVSALERLSTRLCSLDINLPRGHYLADDVYDSKLAVYNSIAELSMLRGRIRNGVAS